MKWHRSPHWCGIFFLQNVWGKIKKINVADYKLRPCIIFFKNRIFFTQDVSENQKIPVCSLVQDYFCCNIYIPLLYSTSYFQRLVLDESVFLLLYHHSYLIAYLAGIILNYVTRTVAAATGSSNLQQPLSVLAT
jgi:hypothetical protein